MKGLLELLSLVALAIMLGGLVRAGYGAIAVTPEYGDGSMDTASMVFPSLIWSAGGLIAFILLSQVKKRI